MTGLTIWSSENSGNPLGSYRDKTILTGPGNIFKAFLIMKSKFIEYIVLKQVVSHGGGGGTPIHYLYGYVPPNGVVILKLLI